MMISKFEDELEKLRSQRKKESKEKQVALDQLSELGQLDNNFNDKKSLIKPNGNNIFGHRCPFDNSKLKATWYEPESNDTRVLRLLTCYKCDFIHGWYFNPLLG